MTDSFDFLYLLSQLTGVLSAVNLILAVSLIIYIATHNLWNSVARSFAWILLFVSIVYAADIILSRQLSPTTTITWLKVQWIGIAMVPAAYLHFSDALLRTTNASSRRRRLTVAATYLIGLLFVALALFTPLVVREAVRYADWAPQLTAGPFFWLFMVYFFLTCGWGFANTLWARSRALTVSSRRRMSYLVASFAAPGLAVYPYLVFTSVSTGLAPTLLLSLNLIGTLGVAAMMLVMAYSVAFQGVLAPERIVKRSFLTYLVRGPLQGVLILLTMLAIPRVEMVLGVPRETILAFVVVGGILIFEVLQRLIEPALDLFAYRADREEFLAVRSLEERLLTSGDIRELLDNLLTAVGDLLRARNGLVLQVQDGVLKAEAMSGNSEQIQTLIGTLSPAELVVLSAAEFDPTDWESWIERDRFRLFPLRTDSGENTLGFLAVEPTHESQPLTPREAQLMDQYLYQMEVTLRDQRLQQGIFHLLQALTPQLETLQAWRSATPFPDALPPTLESAISPINDEEFNSWVKDAFGHYWGGPQLTESPLLALRVVRDKLSEHDNNPARALRAVLTDALDALKPEGEREMTTPEWLLYNILDLKYIQGRRAREVANRLAMSESDLYRKQRRAIDEVAKAIGQMEEASTREAALRLLETE
ncbi:MAG: hypothetical protein KDD73_04690 [Anaerolineales bacterium]|nr:hypothetical protein [Anaerolineales bacterium]MCB9128348.1 hypothetical protein [Ardenticatenales bacterium]MCB9172160.1 hypothetical protein [Ardenticatenales bacterium]